MRPEREGNPGEDGERGRKEARPERLIGWLAAEEQPSGGEERSESVNVRNGPPGGGKGRGSALFCAL